MSGGPEFALYMAAGILIAEFVRDWLSELGWWPNHGR
jgi:hypothetical protein